MTISQKYVTKEDLKEKAITLSETLTTKITKTVTELFLYELQSNGAAQDDRFATRLLDSLSGLMARLEIKVCSES